MEHGYVAVTAVLTSAGRAPMMLPPSTAAAADLFEISGFAGRDLRIQVPQPR
jgi:hypothetical protein